VVEATPVHIRDGIESPKDIATNDEPPRPIEATSELVRAMGFIQR
jgi:hypothetical protein